MFPALMVAAVENLIMIQVNIIGSCIRLAYAPKSWRVARVVFIPKPGKDSYQVKPEWRPISLTLFFLKTLERVVDWVPRS